MNQTILISGVHGVGKTTLCEKVAQESGFKHIIGSVLLTEFTGEKDSKNIHSNADFIVRLLQQKQREFDRILLDSHSVLFDDTFTIMKVEESIFMRSGITKIIFIQDDPGSIQKRLKLRDNQDFSCDFLKQLQDTEREYLGKISDMLQVPYQILDRGKIGPDNIETTLFHCL